jgi:glucosamine kinase
VEIQFLIGVDGGGSGTRVRVLNVHDGRPLGAGQAGPSSLSQGLSQAQLHIGQAISRAFGGAVPDPARCAIGLGLAGVHVPALREDFLRRTAGWGALALDTDSHVALLGAHRGPGVVVAAGTGSVGEALLADGRRSGAGGWGFPVGDEGSGAWLGLRAMAFAQRALDGRAAPGALSHAVLQQCGPDEPGLRAWLENAGQQRFAQLAPLVFEHESDDPEAARLIDRATQALAELALALDPDAALPLAVVGGIGERLAPRLPAVVHRRLVKPAGDAVDGALLLARRALESQR